MKKYFQLSFLLLYIYGAYSFKPIIIIPGTGGSRLEAKLNKPAVNHWYCSKTSDWYTLWLSVASLLPPAINCWVDNIMLLWDPNTKLYSNNLGKLQKHNACNVIQIVQACNYYTRDIFFYVFSLLGFCLTLGAVLCFMRHVFGRIQYLGECSYTYAPQSSWDCVRSDSHFRIMRNHQVAIGQSFWNYN